MRGRGAWEQLPGTIPGDAIGVRFSILPTAPELIDVAFRVRSIMGGSRSDWSAEAPYQRGPRPPTMLTAFSSPSGDVQLLWDRRTAVADAIHVERSPGAQGALWTDVALLDAGATSYLDASVAESTPYQYRVVYFAGPLAGPPVEASTSSGQPLAPSGVAVALGTGGARVEWTNRSPTATALRAERLTGFGDSLGTTVATLPASATSFVDPGSFVGYRAYALHADSGYGTSMSAWASIAAPPATGLSLTGRIVGMPGPAFIARGAGEAWATAGFDGIAVLDGGAWRRHPLDAARTVAPGVAFDGAGALHAVFTRQTPGAFASDLVHVVYAAGRWTEEVVTTAEAIENVNGCDVIGFALAPSGAVKIAWATAAGGLRWAENDGGAWSLLPGEIPVSEGTPACPLRVAADADGVLHVATALVYSQILVVSRPPAPAPISREVLARTPLDLVSSFDLAASPGTLVVGTLWDVSQSPADRSELELAIRTGGTWSTPERVDVTPAMPFPFRASLGGQRAAFVTEHGGQLTLDSRAVDGAWTSTPLGPAVNNLGAAVGFFPDGRVWLAAMGAGGAAGLTHVAVYEQAP